jgi:hypothetical protein
MKLKSDRYVLATTWVILGFVARLLPLPPNMSPMTAISLFGGAQLSRKLAFLLTFTALLASDIALSALRGHEIFGPWTLFTYTGFAAMIFAGGFLKGRLTAGRTLVFLLGSTLGFWVWTNFGIWAVGAHGLYPKTFEGLVACFAAALPFLRNALIGDLAWGMVFFLSFQGVRQLAPRFGWSVQGA